MLVLDVDQKDPGLALRCPPECFVEQKALESAREALTEDGIMGKFIFRVFINIRMIDNFRGIQNFGINLKVYSAVKVVDRKEMKLIQW